MTNVLIKIGERPKDALARHTEAGRRVDLANIPNLFSNDPYLGGERYIYDEEGLVYSNILVLCQHTPEPCGEPISHTVLLTENRAQGRGHDLLFTRIYTAKFFCNKHSDQHRGRRRSDIVIPLQQWELDNLVALAAKHG